MSLFGYQNKIRLCLTIFASLIFLDIVAFFDSLLSPIVSFQHFEEERPGVERENLTIQKRTENDRDEWETEEEVIDSELVHNVAVVLVEVLGLSILLVTIPHPLSLNVEQCLTLFDNA